MSEKQRILLTNDDGYESPGLWAAAETLAPLAELWICAPRTQATSAARSTPPVTDGKATFEKVNRNGHQIQAYSIGATPAQTVQFAVLEIMPEKPDLVISGINYGINTGIDITRSGTIGAALEAASFGIPSLAVSMQVAEHETFSHSKSVDFSVAGFFTAYFAKLCFNQSWPSDVDVLKIEVPAQASTKTGWEVVSQASVPLYIPKRPQRSSYNEPCIIKYGLESDYANFPENTDANTVFVKKKVAVTPLSLNLTSRVNLNDLETQLRK
jgi:5'-nucleotidase